MQFRTKARAVDLLGKGQIADLPTAITELWKNGYDAYADNLSAEMYMKGYKGLESPIFVISDDGKGMSRKDIIENWLVLGTDAKSRAILEDEPTEETLWKTPRVKAGEKGIGRLSVAFLGSPMLMLTKKRGYPLQALFFDWRLLENYNLFLDDVSIPVEDIKSVSDFSLQFEKLKDSFLRNFDKETDDDGRPIWEDTQKTGIQTMLFDLEDPSKPRSQKQLRENIINSVRKSRITVGVLEELTTDLTNLVQHNGTKFLIFEPIEQLVNLYGDIDKEDEIEDKNFVLSSLLGFTNSFKDNSLKINVSMPIHFKYGHDKDILMSEGNFFTSEDYALSDVVIDGEFDGLGTFSGELVIYDEVIPYNFTNPRRRKSKSNYGNVVIKLGYSQGVLSASKLDEPAYKGISKKLEAYGGLYIYRDGFRVLPYGRANMDFLSFEERRSKSAGQYYFSYRRMLGYLEISREGNPDLIDKSSREGLITNAPYRAFVNDLIAFFVQLAKDYFYDEAKQTTFLEKKKELKQQHLAIKADQERELKERKEYSRLLSEFPEKFNTYKSKYHNLVQELAQKLSQANVAFNDISKVLHEFQKLDIEYKKLIPEYSPRYKPTDSQLDRKVKFESMLESFASEINQEKEPLVKKAMEVLEIKDLINQFSNDYRNYQAALETLIINHKTKLSDKFNDIIREYTERAKKILNEFSSGKENMIASIRTKDDIFSQMGHVSQKFESFRNQIDKELIPLVNHFERLSFDFDEEQIQGIYKEQFQQIKRQWSDIQETAQLGIAVEIIDHEFNVLYATINRMLATLHEANTIGTNENFMRLETAFKYLEDKYALLSPMYRISDAIAKEIRCNTLVDYIKDFFSTKINAEGIVISSTAAFDNFSIKIKEPVIHTVLINIVNNAIFWLRNSERKEIRFDYYKETNEILILNSGEKIEDHRIEKVFDLFYSNRPNGRGIGLFLVKQTLNQHYFDIYSTNDAKYNYLNGACFVIKPLK